MTDVKADARRAAKHERIVKAAVDHVYNPNCPNARKELEAAVYDLVRVRIPTAKP